MSLGLPVSNKLAAALLIGILAVIIPVAATNQDVVQALIGVYTQAKEDLLGTMSSIDASNPECANALQMVNETLSKADSLIESAETSMSVGNYRQAESLVIRAINMIGDAYQMLYKCGIAETGSIDMVNATVMGQLNRTQMLLSKVMNAVMRANATVNITPVMEHLREAERLMQQASLMLMQNRTNDAVSLMIKIENRIREAYRAMERVTEKEREHMKAQVPENATIVNMSGAPEEVMERARGMVRAGMAGNSSAALNVTNQHGRNDHGHGTPDNTTSEGYVEPPGMKGTRKGGNRGNRGEVDHVPGS